MNLVVDTSVWSLVLRRRQVDYSSPYVATFQALVQKGDCIHLLGSVLQELLDGVNSVSDFERLSHMLKSFPLIALDRDTYISASQLRNHCRRKGIQAGPIDFLIAAACIQYHYPLLTCDRDFHYMAQHCDLVLISTGNTA